MEERGIEHTDASSLQRNAALVTTTKSNFVIASLSALRSNISIAFPSKGHKT